MVTTIFETWNHENIYLMYEFGQTSFTITTFQLSSKGGGGIHSFSMWLLLATLPIFRHTTRAAYAAMVHGFEKHTRMQPFIYLWKHLIFLIQSFINRVSW